MSDLNGVVETSQENLQRGPPSSVFRLFVGDLMENSFGPRSFTVGRLSSGESHIVSIGVDHYRVPFAELSL